MECKKEDNKTACTCQNNECENKGICCQCVAAHRANGNLPHCLRNLDDK